MNSNTITIASRIVSMTPPIDLQPFFTHTDIPPIRHRNPIVYRSPSLVVGMAAASRAMSRAVSVSAVTRRQVLPRAFFLRKLFRKSSSSSPSVSPAQRESACAALQRCTFFACTPCYWTVRASCVHGISNVLAFPHEFSCGTSRFLTDQNGDP